MRSTSLLLLLLSIASPAFASDGVLEINQTCAVETGCFSGDAPGFPVAITGAEGRSYRLTSDLVLPDRNTSAINITRRDTSLDLNGFEIIFAPCQVLTCAPVSGSGIGVAAQGVLGVSVKNGTITATGNDGIRLGNQAMVSDVRVRWNGGDGIAVGDGSIVSDSIAFQNGRTGIFVGDGSTVSGNTAYENTANGISVNFASTVSGNTAYRNGSDGIQAEAGCNVMGNTVRLNDIGLDLGPESSYRANLIGNNMSLPVTGGVDAGANTIDGVVTPTP